MYVEHGRQILIAQIMRILSQKVLIQIKQSDYTSFRSLHKIISGYQLC